MRGTKKTHENIFTHVQLLYLFFCFLFLDALSLSLYLWAIARSSKETICTGSFSWLKSPLGWSYSAATQHQLRVALSRLCNWLEKSRRVTEQPDCDKDRNNDLRDWLWAFNCTKVLVHCASGISRSSTVCMAHLMISEARAGQSSSIGNILFPCASGLPCSCFAKIVCRSPFRSNFKFVWFQAKHNKLCCVIMFLVGMASELRRKAERPADLNGLKNWSQTGKVQRRQVSHHMQRQRSTEAEFSWIGEYLGSHARLVCLARPFARPS